MARIISGIVNFGAMTLENVVVGDNATIINVFEEDGDDDGQQ